ncbi:ribonuclease III [Leptolyngbya sp. AN02str]|uniref:ribonuclease III n=1 Tax=Leptolyngbya sp. AN02str TaxID=3423363 RepID=UPI003D30F0E8
MTTYNHEQVGKALQFLRQGLHRYVEQKMQAAYPGTWITKVRDCLKDILRKRPVQDALREDVAVALSIVLRQWDEVFKATLSRAEHGLVSELIDVRNRWAHQSTFTSEDAYRATDSVVRLLAAIGAPEASDAEGLKHEMLRSLLKEQSRPETSNPVSSERETQARERLAELLKRLPFRNALLLSRALTHRSYIFEHPTETEGDNEQLEFLGDSVLGFLAGDYLCRRFPGRSEQELTLRRSSLVDNAQLAEFSKELNLGQWILLGNGEELTGGRTKPSLLSNIFEAVIGAYYLDSDIESVRELVEPLFDQIAGRSPTKTSAPSPTHLVDPKGRLQHYALAEHSVCPQYVVINESGPDHDRTRTVEAQIAGKVYGVGTARGKCKEAEKRAAIDALSKLGLL